MLRVIPSLSIFFRDCVRQVAPDATRDQGQRLVKLNRKRLVAETTD